MSYDSSICNGVCFDASNKNGALACDESKSENNSGHYSRRSNVKNNGFIEVIQDAQIAPVNS